MDFIHKLPFILGAFMTIMVGGISYRNDITGQALYIRMAISITVFYILGIYIRKMLKNTISDIQKRKEEEERERQEEEKKQREKDSEDENYEKGSSFDVKVGEDEDFSPLKVSEVIKSKINN